MFGTWLGMSFNSGAMTALPDKQNQMRAPYQPACISDPATGKLLFYTNGQTVWNTDNQVMPIDIATTTSCPHSLIIPDPADPNLYYIIYSDNITTLYYAKVDMREENGKGNVIDRRKKLANTPMDLQMSAVKQMHGTGYWLITHRNNTNEFWVYSITKNGIDPDPVVSSTGPVTNPGAAFTYGKMNTNQNGTMLFYGINNNTGWSTPMDAAVFDIDKVCGTISLRHILYGSITQATETHATGAFDATGKYCYVSFYNSMGVSSVYQFDVTAADPNANKVRIAFSTDMNTDLQLAPDKKIYVAGGSNLLVSSRVGVINNPSLPGLACDFRDRSIELSMNPFPGSVYVEYFPNVIHDNTPSLPDDRMLLINMKKTCLNEQAYVSLGDSLRRDSLYWEVDSMRYWNTSGFTHTFTRPGVHACKLVWYNCGTEFVYDFNIYIGQVPQFALGADTTLCAGINLFLSVPPNPVYSYLWSDGSRGTTLLAKTAGKYWVRVADGECAASDTVDLRYHPDIITSLGDEYFLCEDDAELAKLDAGEGFQQYRWTPTGDTTQWIKVMQVGDYFVMVKDYNGCEGTDAARVKRRCGVTLFFPTAFTPNNNGLNDTYQPIGNDVVSFRMTVYNRWGVQVYSTLDLNKGWNGKTDGQYAPEGTYVYECTYTGYRNKRLQQFHQKGHFTLLR